MNTPLHVLIVDDDPLVCSALSMIVGANEDLVVAGSASNGEQAIETIRQAAAQGRRIDVVLMDLRMGGMGGIQATAHIRALPEAPEVIAVTTWDVDDAVVRCVEAGASGFLLKTAAPEEIVRAIRAVAAGDAVLSPRSTRQFLDRFATTQVEAHGQARALVDALTDRERDVARLVGQGLTNVEIAEALYVSEATVKTHLSSLQLKLQARNRVAVAVMAERAGLLAS